MEDILIVNSYIDTPRKEEVLRHSLQQLKKLNVRIILISNSILSENLLSLCDYYIFNNSNELLPESESPISWFAEGNETVHLYNKGIGYAIIKNINLAVNFAHTLKAKRFIFMEYDTVIHDKDLPLLSDMFHSLKTKKAFFCKFEAYRLAYETRIFGGDVDFFVERVPLPITHEEWVSTYPYSSHSETLEYVFPILFEPHIHQIELVNLCNRNYFKHSEVDIFSINRECSIIYNLENRNRPLLFILGNSKRYTIYINDKLTDTTYVTGGEYKKYYFDIDHADTTVKVESETEKYTYTVNTSNIDEYKKIGVTFKLT